MMSMCINRSRNGLQFIFYILCLIELSTICMSLVSGSDMLIIRHGRSRVRHSSEKKHIRWGLHAFDNLTLSDYDYESSNGTNGSNETFIDTNFGGSTMASGTNQTLFGTDTFGYYSTEFIFNNNLNSNTNDTKLISTLAPASTGTFNQQRWSSTQSLSPPTKRKHGKKKRIMASIRKNVEEGIVYLRTHGRHSRPTAIMPNGLHKKQQQQQQQIIEQRTSIENTDEVDATSNENQFSLDENGSMISNPLSISKFIKLPLTQPFNHVRNQQQQHNQSNQKRMKNEKPTLPSSSSGSQLRKTKRPTMNSEHDENDDEDDDDDNDNSGDDVDDSNDLIDSDEMPSHNERIYFDFDMQNDGPDTIGTETDSYPIHSKTLKTDEHFRPNNKNSDDSRNINGDKTKLIDSQHPILNAAAATTTTTTSITTTTTITSAIDATIKNVKHNLNGNGVDANYFRSNKKLNKTLPTHLKLVNDMKREQQHQQMRAKQQNQKLAIAKGIQPGFVSRTGGNNATKQNDSMVSIARINTKSFDNNHNHKNDQFELNGILTAFDELNDEQQTANDESDDDDDGLNSFPFDANYEQNFSFDGKSDNPNDILQPAIFRMEDIDLDDLDETSRNNRLNLMKGRDVVTNFLQIVESQHLLGANCTAGTALNLGEGVVDRYAQDRFRVEAEVAVNRANMLTR